MPVPAEGREIASDAGAVVALETGGHVGCWGHRVDVERDVELDGFGEDRPEEVGVVEGAADMASNQGTDESVCLDAALELCGRSVGFVHREIGKGGETVWMSFDAGGEFVVGADAELFGGVVSQGRVGDDLLGHVAFVHWGKTDFVEGAHVGGDVGGVVFECLAILRGLGGVGAEEVLFEADGWWER